jgi:putative ABC transport system ATP-binding protein
MPISGTLWRRALGGNDMAVLAAFDIYRFFHTRESETLALRGVSLRLNEGELVALVGPSGSGKSTLLACLAGLDEPDGGYVELLGERLTRRTEAERARRRGANIGILMQSGNLFPSLSVAENMRLAMFVAGKIESDRAKELLAEVGLANRVDARPGQLSGGELARAGLAVALAPAPPILLADEPTGEVDAVTERSILSILNEQCRAGVAVLVATHSRALAAHADRIIHLRDGRVGDA